ncbi:hypothetical protein [Streptoalloteichus hindustanus]|uniref:Zinc-finger n=1 Tax=Streptoalloteichus hindustanus TaxID=2017 RepID=A0A1M4YTQ9_STRHI|nr:hypothetical protein [Streptoalloteichus hindustanus]SHF08726.1 hypothetical protein SAMN05444320_102466 [Streptoalloteichus hindustanus]
MSTTISPDCPDGHPHQLSHTWLPFQGLRHAYAGNKQDSGVAVTLFCDVTAVSTSYPPDHEEWLHWPECGTCRDVAKARVARLAEMRSNWLPAYGSR